MSDTSTPAPETVDQMTFEDVIRKLVDLNAQALGDFHAKAVAALDAEYATEEAADADPTATGSVSANSQPSTPAEDVQVPAPDPSGGPTPQPVA